VVENGYDLSKFKVFVCYHEESDYDAKGFAEIVYYILNVIGVQAFVAHIERNKYSEDFDKTREKLIPACEYFIYINTEGGFIRPEIQKEFRIAYPNGLADKPKFLIFRYNSAKVIDSDFEAATGITLSHNQPTFNNERDLVELVKEMIETYHFAANVPSEEQLEKEVKLRKYLK
jgi:hypothetical protein